MTVRIAAFLLVLVAGSLPSAPASRADAPVFSAWSVPTSGAQLVDIAPGPDGNVWFTERAANRVAHATPGGSIMEIVVPTGGSSPTGITAGPDGNLWFTEQTANKIGRVSPLGAFAEFTLPTPDAYPTLITLGPDGNLWFTEHAVGKIGRITPDGSITEFAIPEGGMPLDITAGPDGRLWFTNFSAHRIGAVTTDGAFTAYDVPTPNSGPFVIAVGPDGRLWFTERYADTIGAITTGGAFTEFPTPTAGDLVGITAGTDGNLWFTEYNGNKVGTITPAGTITEYDLPIPGTGPHHVTTGPNGDVWFTEDTGNAIGSVAIPRPTATATTTPTPTRTPTVTPTPTVTATPPCGAPLDLPCRAPTLPGRSQILLKDRASDANDLLAWKWTHGTATTKADFGDPLHATSYDVCVYDERGLGPELVYAATIAPGGTCADRPCWRATAHGFLYKDEAGARSGIRTMALREGLEGRAGVSLEGRGPALALPALPLRQDPRVLVRLVSSDGRCWAATFGHPAFPATTAQFRDKSD